MITGLVITAIVLILIAALAPSVKKTYAAPEAKSASPDYSHLDDFPIQIVGESNYQSTLIDLCGPPKPDGYRTRLTAMLCREPGNPHDPNAIRVDIQGRTVGYIDRSQAAQWAPRMDALPSGASQATVPAIVMGGWYKSASDHGAFGVRIARPDLPRKPRAKKAAKA